MTLPWRIFTWIITFLIIIFLQTLSYLSPMVEIHLNRCQTVFCLLARESMLSKPQRVYTLELKKARYLRYIGTQCKLTIRRRYLCLTTEVLLPAARRRCLLIGERTQVKCCPRQVIFCSFACILNEISVNHSRHGLVCWRLCVEFGD